MRDDFSQQSKEVLAKRVAFRCSNPKCRMATSGPQSDATKSVNLGIAAHITAASPGGPRYNHSLSTEQRSSIENGIWLCQRCAKLVDNDPKRYSAEKLHNWKRIAEKKALLEIESSEHNSINLDATTNIENNEIYINVLWYADGMKRYNERPWFTMADIISNYYSALNTFYREGTLTKSVDICVSNFPKYKDLKSGIDQALDTSALEAIFYELVTLGYLKNMGVSIYGEKYEITDKGTYYFNKLISAQLNKE